MGKIWKIIKWIVIAVISFLLLDLAVVIFFSVYRPTVQKADAIVVLGAAINTPATYNRTLEGLKLYNQGKAPVLILSGGVDYPGSVPEALYMKRVVLANSSGTPNMLLDESSHSTWENIENSKALVPNAHSIIIVSDTFHIARGVLTAKMEGFSPVYWSSPNSAAYYSPDELIFYYFREAAAMVDYVPKFVFGK